MSNASSLMPRARGRVALMVGLALVMAACGDQATNESEEGSSAPAEQAADDTGSEASEPEELQPLKVAFVNGAVRADVHYALEQGYFEEAGLEVELLPSESGPAVTAAVTSGEAQIGAQATVPMVRAVIEGLPLKTVATSAQVGYPEQVDDYADAVLLARSDSGIESAADLNGKTVAVNALEASIQLQVMAAVDQQGGDSASLTFTALPFPDMASALEAGHVDAIAAIEPFVTSAAGAGNQRILAGFPYEQDAGLDFIASVWFASDDFVANSSDQIDAFLEGLDRAHADFADDLDTARDTVPTFTRIPPEVAAQIQLPNWDTAIDRAEYDALFQLMVDYGFVANAPSHEDFFAASAS